MSVFSVVRECVFSRARNFMRQDEWEADGQNCPSDAGECAAQRLLGREMLLEEAVNVGRCADDDTVARFVEL